MRKLLDSQWFFYFLAALLLVGAVYSQLQFEDPGRPKGGVEDLLELKSRDDVNVIFILIDMLRADRLSAYGYGRQTSPVLQELANHGILFEKVESQSSWTKASMASIWTAMYPERTGVQRFFHALPEEARLPAEIFQESDFRTGGIWRNGWVAANFGFAQGFDLYVRPLANYDPGKYKRFNPSAHALRGTDLDATESAMEFLHSLGDERFFLYIHYMDVHQYLYADVSPNFGTTFSDIYDSSIYWTDHNIGFLMEDLERVGLLDDTLVVIASDHGEAFFEHGDEGHARTLYREVQAVPLIIVPPFEFQEGVRVSSAVANVDIFPTVFDLLGMAQQPGAEGRSLVPLILDAAGASPEDDDVARLEELKTRSVFSQLDRSWGRFGAESNPLVAVVDGPHRLVHQVSYPDAPQLYDEREDPEELKDVSKEQPETVARLRKQVEGFLAIPKTQWEEVPEVQLDEMRQNQLRALGYIIDGERKTPRQLAAEQEQAEPVEQEREDE